jgi:hypothetical protein
MISSTRFVLVVVVLSVSSLSVQAAPQLEVLYDGIVGDNHRWQIAVAPDPEFFTNTIEGFGSSLATELAFKVEGSSIVPGTVAINSADWMYENPGNNPFTNSVTFGVWLSGPLDEAFAALGSEVFLSGDLVDLFSFQTLGTAPTTVHYGVAASGHPVNGSIIAQLGQNFPVGLLTLSTGGIVSLGGPSSYPFTGYSGSVSSVPEPCCALLIGLGAIAGAIGGRRMR